MLWHRVLTAMVLIPLVVAGVLMLDTAVLALVFGVIVLLGSYELGHLANLDNGIALILFVAAVGVVLWMGWRFLLPTYLVSVQWIVSIWWVLTTVLLVTRRRQLKRVSGPRPATLLLGALILVVAWSSVIGLHGSGAGGPTLVLFLLVLIWVADSGAYFAGRAFGKTKLSPVVSPGKTWAGVFGALAAAMVSAWVLTAGGWAGNAALVALTMLSLLVTAVSIGGDLWESRLKREAGVKDSGNLLPGHGGVLDRIDSLLAAAPVFALGAALVGAVT